VIKSFNLQGNGAQLNKEQLKLHAFKLV